MAKNIVTQYTDDIDGSRAQGTIQFSYNGSAYEIDLSTKNAKAFEKALSPYIDAARKIRRPAGATTRRARHTPAANLADVRAWAQSNGYEVAGRGRIPAAVLEAFENR
jgi:hypothetical protein